MVSRTQSAYELRVHRAVKWNILDQMEVDEIQQKFRDEYDIDLTEDTIRGYLNSTPAEEVIETVRKRNAHTREQVMDREEGAYWRAREDEKRATEAVAVKAARPWAEENDTGAAKDVLDWEVIDHDDPEAPDWATEDDIVITFLDETTTVAPGEQYYQPDPAGNPQYKIVPVGIERDIPDLSARKSLRQEQRQHLEAKGDAAAIYEENVNVEVTPSQEYIADLQDDGGQ